MDTKDRLASLASCKCLQSDVVVSAERFTIHAIDFVCWKTLKPESDVRGEITLSPLAAVGISKSSLFDGRMAIKEYTRNLTLAALLQGIKIARCMVAAKCLHARASFARANTNSILSLA